MNNTLKHAVGWKQPNPPVPFWATYNGGLYVLLFFTVLTTVVAISVL